MMDDRHIYTEIDKAIENKCDIVFISYSMLDETDEKIRYTVQRIMEKYDREDWFTPVFSAVKELTANALKANAKKILIDEGIIKETDPILEVVKKLRTILNERAVLEYGIKKKKKALSTRIYFRLQPDRIIIKVINNLPLDDFELKRIHERVKLSSKYDSIAEFFMDYPDPAAEGMGLGLCMVVTLLKSINIDYSNFSITTDGIGKTCAEMTIPLN
ncbi:MAG: hypothetical protein JXN64_14375 [Spirochaetes bacterium]|nr:hypothetical protein [Spirochaetota bacterium]